MNPHLGRLAAAGALLAALSAAGAAHAQRQGGVLKIYFFDSPASVSIHEETTAAGQGPVMGVFNNLVMYKQDVPQSGMQSIMPDLARVVLGRGQDPPDVQTARRDQMARRQTLYREGRAVHLGSPHREVERETAHQSAQGLVPQPRRGHRQWRL